MNMHAKNRRPAGSWPSQITPDMIVAGSRRLADPRIVDNDLIWLEGRPEEKGRVVLVRERQDGTRVDLTPQPFSVRSMAHEYGGGVYALLGDDVFFVNAADQRVYKTSAHGDRTTPPQALTRSNRCYYGDLLADPKRQRLIAVSEDHAGEAEAETTLIAIDANTGKSVTLARGHDFFSSPTIDPSGDHLAWLSWDHPDMPWDATTLWHATFDKRGALTGELNIGHPNTSHFQPQFSPAGELYVVADTSDWWNLYHHTANGLQPIAPCSREFAFPQWTFGMSTYGFSDAHTIVAASTADGTWTVDTIDLHTGARTPLQPFEFSACDQLNAGAGRVILIAGSATQSMRIVSRTVGTDAQHWRTHQRSNDLEIEASAVAVPQPMTFRAGRDDACHGFFYAPTNPEFELGDGEAPPVLVKCHGGPTGSTANVLDPRIQFWTSRGIAVLDLDYRGSTGYGRAYRHSLRGQWGIFDVLDCRHAVAVLAEQGLVDRARCLISGGSAGGYTVLCALTFDDVFAAGASHYGIGDLELLVKDTHKFESRYLDRMVGPYPEYRDTYVARSPINHVEQLNCPVIFFQGLDDKVVPPNQAQTMVAALRDNDVLVGYVPFEGEGHGFRRADNIKFALSAELAFYGHVLGFEPAGTGIDLDEVLVTRPQTL